MLSPTRAHMHISRSWFVYPSHLSVCRSVSLSPPRAAVHTWSHQPALTSARQAPQYSRQSARRLQVCLSFLRTVGYTRLQRSSVCVRVCVCQFPKWVMCVCTTGRRAGKGGWAWGQGLALVEQIVWDKRQYFVPGQQSWGSAEFVKVINLSEWFVPLFFFLFFFFFPPPPVCPRLLCSGSHTQTPFRLPANPLLGCVSVHFYETRPTRPSCSVKSLTSRPCNSKSNDRNKHCVQRKWAHILLTSQPCAGFTGGNHDKLVYYVARQTPVWENTSTDEEVGGLARKCIQFFHWSFLSPACTETHWPVTVQGLQ